MIPVVRKILLHDKLQFAITRLRGVDQSIR